MRPNHTPYCPSNPDKQRRRAIVAVAATILLAGVGGYVRPDQAAGRAVSKAPRADRMSGRVVIRFQDATIDAAVRHRMKALGRTIQARPTTNAVDGVKDAYHLRHLRPLFSAIESPGRMRSIASRAVVPQLGTFYVATVPPETDLDAIIAQLNADPRIAHAWQDRAIAAQLDPVDPHYDQQ